MAGERLDPRLLFEKMVEFARLGPQLGVNIYNLRGPIDVPTVFDFFAAIFPRGTGLYSYALIDASPGPPGSQASYYKKILELELPERIKRLTINDDPEVKRRLELFMALNGMPSVMVGFGKARDTGEEVAVLFAVGGISPETALREIQDDTRSRAARLN